MTSLGCGARSCPRRSSAFGRSSAGSDLTARSGGSAAAPRPGPRTHDGRWGILDWSPTLTSALATAYARNGRLAEAITLHERADDEEAREAQGTPSVGILRFGETYLLAGRIDDARACAERALGLARTGGERSIEARALRLLGEVAAGGPPPDADQSERLFSEALARSQALGLRPDVARCHLGLAALYAHAGRREQSAPRLETALRMFRELAMPYWIEQAARALQELGEIR